jgi:hypothetical protein
MAAKGSVKQRPAAKAKKKARSKSKPGRGLTELIARALTDQEYRSLLFKDRAKALVGYRLSASDRAALAELGPDQLEAHADSLSKGRKLPITVKVQVTKHF